MEARAEPVESSLRRHLGDFIAGVRHWAAKEQSRRQARAEIDALDRAGALDDVLRELSLSRAEIDDIVNVDPDSPQRLERMLARLGLTEAVPAASAIGHDVQRVCQRCSRTSTCEHWLEAGAQEGFESFCPNAETFQALRG